jgi:hypothetical protein
MAEQIYLSRRNLMALLSKLDHQAASGSTACTIIKFRNSSDPFIQSMDTIAVTAVEDDVYYTSRNPGIMHPRDEAVIKANTAELIANINLPDLPLGHPVYTGHGVGLGAREIFKLDDLDSMPCTIMINASSDTYSISDSFWRGLLEDSLNKLGDRESAKRKFKFNGPSQFQDSFQAYIIRHFIFKKG